jgi:hypothetical protein
MIIFYQYKVMRFNLKIPSQLKRLYGSLSIVKIQNGIKSTKKILGFARDIDKIAGEHNLEHIKGLTGRLVNNEAFGKLEKGVNVADTLISGYKQHRETGLFNPPPLNENQEASRIVGNKKRRPSFERVRLQ